MKKFYLWIAISLFSLLVVNPAITAAPIITSTPKAEWEKKWENVLTKAKKEGKLTIYANLGPKPRTQLSKAFTAKYGINIEFVVGTGSEIVQKITMEQRAGLYLADVIIGGATTAIDMMKPEKILVPVDKVILLPDIDKPELWVGNKGPFMDKEKMIVPLVATYNRYLMRNVNLAAEGEITSYRDLLKPRYGKKIIMTDPTTTGTGNAWVSLLVRAWGLEQATDYLRKFVRQDPLISRNRRQIVEWLAKAKYSLAVAPHLQTAADFKRLGSPIAYVKVDEGGLITAGAGCLSLPRNPPHPDSASLFINWLLSKEGQAVFAPSFGGPSARKDVSTTGVDQDFFPNPGETVFMEDEEGVLAKGKLLKLSKDIFAPLLK